MKNLILCFLLASTAAACNQKDELDCVAYASDGTKLYEVVSSETCEEQINVSEGEYCQCVE